VKFRIEHLRIVVFPPPMDRDPVQPGSQALDIETLEKDFVGRLDVDDDAIRA
jgi:hypothetical protein